MKAKVAHISLNARGGAERLSVSVVKALSEMGADIELCTYEKPDPRLMVGAYGEPVVDRLKKLTSLELFSSLFKTRRKSDSDIFINTHGDMLPYFQQQFSKDNALVYCHYPIAGCLIDSDDKDYLDLLYNLGSSHLLSSEYSRFLDAAKDIYRKMLLNSRVLTNSEFSRKAIFKMYGVDSTVLYPPVNTGIFQRHGLSSGTRADDILVISRFQRSKKIENAIYLASLLSKRSVGRRMVIVGNISPDGLDYYQYLRRLAKRYGVKDYVRFEPSASFSRLLDLVRSSKVYLHPLPGEPFGISTVESMSAGLIPVVPDIGGHTEFVPPQYQFHTYEQGVDAVVEALNAPASEHLWMSHRASAFSVPNFVGKFKEIVSEMTGLKKAHESRQLMPARKIPSDSAA